MTVQLAFFISPCGRDTVNSVGIIPRHLPFTSSNASIRIFRHALSLDEHRAKFRPNFYHWSAGTEGTKTEEMPKADVKNGKSGEKQSDQARANEDDIDGNETRKIGTDVLEVWFAGCHTGAFHNVACLSAYL